MKVPLFEVARFRKEDVLFQYRLLKSKEKEIVARINERQRLLRGGNNYAFIIGVQLLIQELDDEREDIMRMLSTVISKLSEEEKKTIKFLDSLDKEEGTAE